MKNFFDFVLFIKNLMFHQPRTAAQDKVAGIATVYAGPAAGMIHLRNKTGSTTKFKNFVYSLSMPFTDSVSGTLEVQGIYTRTTPVSDADYAGLDIGSTCLFLTVTSRATTEAAYYLKTIDGFVKFITSGGDNTIDAVATTARAGSSWYGLRLKSRAATGIAITGNQAGLYLETELTGTATCSGSHYGIKIETYVTSAATITGDHYGIAIFTYSDIAGSQAIDCIRLEHNGASVANAFLNLQSAAGKMTYLVSSSTTDNLWMSITTTPTCATAGGWYRVKHGGYTRYIQLYTSVS